eukprot:g1865.t1
MLLPASPATSPPAGLTVDIVVDGSTHKLAFQRGDDLSTRADEFCRAHGLTQEISLTTGAGCAEAVVGLLEETARAAGQREARTNVTFGEELALMPPKTSFPFAIRDDYLRAQRDAARETPVRTVVSAYVFGHDASLVSMCDGIVLGVIELERLPGGQRYFDLAATARKALTDSGRDRIVMDHISRAQVALAKLTLSTDSDCISDGVSIESLRYDAGVIVDAQTPLWLQRLVQQAVPLSDGASWITVNHHYSHALLGWYDSPYYFSPASSQTPTSQQAGEETSRAQPTTLILSYDGFGNDGSFCVFVARDHGNENINDIPDPLSALHRLVSKPLSLGQTYIQVANLLPHFWTMDEETNTLTAPCPYAENPACQLRLPGILMAYAALGRPRTEWRHGMRRLLKEGIYDTRHGAGMPALRQQLLQDLDERGQRDFAATAQSVFEEIVVDEVAEAIELLHRDEPHAVVASLVVTGGCALNVRANTVLQNRFQMPVYVPSSPGDCGIAIGGGWSLVPPPRSHINAQQRLEYLGAEIWDMKNLSGLVVDWRVGGFGRVSEADPETVATLLLAGKVGAVVRGRQEVGPRALGHRSLLAVPKAGSCSRMNRIKHRDWYRPCAPVLNEESVEKVFEVTRHEGNSVTSSPYMSFAPLLRPSIQEAFPGIAHVDGTARPQTVSHDRNPWLHRLLSRIGASIGAPILINTSFNTHGKPILNSAREALALLRASSDLDFVVIEDHLFTCSRDGVDSSI